MTAKEYSEKLFGRVVIFNDIEKDCLEYAKVFASGSPELEKTLLKLWDYGIKTFACGNGYDERLENFDLGAEQNIQSRYHDYENTTGISKLMMNLKKMDYLPTYDAYIGIDKRTIEDPDAFSKTIKNNLKQFGKELFFKIEDFENGYYPKMAIHLSVLRNKPCLYHEMCSEYTEKEALFASLPEKTTFDKYFNAISEAIDEYCLKIGIVKGNLDIMQQNNISNIQVENILKNEENEFSLDQMIEREKNMFEENKNDKIKTYENSLDR